MSQPRPLLAAFILAGAFVPTSAFAGILVDHPAIKLASTQGTSIATARMYVEVVELHDCTGGTGLVAVEAELDLLAQDEVPIPAGTWCGVRLISGDSLRVTGIGSNGAAFEINVPIDQIDVRLGDPLSTTTIAVSAIEIGAPGWLAPALLAQHANATSSGGLSLLVQLAEHESAAVLP